MKNNPPKEANLKKFQVEFYAVKMKCQVKFIQGWRCILLGWKSYNHFDLIQLDILQDKKERECDSTKSWSFRY